MLLQLNAGSIKLIKITQYYSMEEIEEKMKGWKRILAIILPYIFIVGIFQFIGSLITGVDITDIGAEQNSIQLLIINIFNLVGTFLVLLMFMRSVDDEPFINLGFHTKNRLKDFIAGIAIGTLIMLIGYFLLILFKEIVFVKVNFDFNELIISILLFTIIAVVEETLFRGYILKNLMLSFNKYIALIVTSIMFSLMHGYNPNIDLFSLLDLFFAGVLLGLSYIYTKNLWFPIGLHLSWNLFQSLLGFNVSGQDIYSVIEFKITEGNLVNGGAFGFEGSYLSIIAEVITFIGIAIYYNRNKYESISK